MALPVRNQRTEVTRWDPFAEVQRLYSELSRFFQGLDEVSPLLGDGFIPLADMEETDDTYIVELELPGVKKRDIDVSLVGRRLAISGERKEKERVGVLRRRTRSMGRFRYEILLPDAVDAEGVTASLDEGVLTVRVPKAVSEQRRRIEVT